MVRDLDVNRVTAALRQLSRELVLPRFRRLSADQVHRKNSPGSPEDLVTEVDREVEAALAEILREVVPDAAFVGEEVAHARPEIMDVLATDRPYWLVDPLDGTRNFVAGNEGFGTMVALVLGGRAHAAWIHLPVTDRAFVAQEGAGAFLDGARLCPPKENDSLSGTVYSDLMPQDLAAEVVPRARERTRVLDGPMAAALEYTSLALGEKDYVVYYRIHPWDHVPGALIVSEAGGEVRLADGRPYGPRERVGPCLAVAARESWSRVRTALFPASASEVGG